MLFTRYKTKKETELYSYLSDFQPNNFDVSSNVEENLHILQKEYFHDVEDLYIREFRSAQNQIVLVVVYLTTIVDRTIIDEGVLNALPNLDDDDLAASEVVEELVTTGIPIANMGIYTDMVSVVNGLLEGKAVFFFKGHSNAYLYSATQIPQRSVEEPTSEMTIHGPRDGFNEDIGTNIGLIRKRIRSHLLKVKVLKLGSITNTQVSILYMDTLARPDIIAEVMSRIQNIQIDSVISAEQLIEFLQDNPYSIFPLLNVTERPDCIVGNLLEGRICILVDGIPFVIFGPITLLTLIQSPDDYYFSPYISTALRFLRILAIGISLLLPSLYIALISFHQEMIPTKLVLSIQKGREAVPFPSLIEVIIMEIAFEILREAGTRLPKMLGATVSVVGGLIIGEAVVRAGIISPLMVVIVSSTAISSFAIPSFHLAISLRILRFIFIGLAGFSGFFGIIWGILMLMIHLSGLRSLSVPFFTPIAPFVIKDWKDTMLRLPFWNLNSYPKHLVKGNLKKFVKPIFRNNRGDNR